MILNAKKQLQSKRKYLCMTPYIWHTVSLLITIQLLSTSLFSHYLPEFPLFPLPAVGKPGVCNKPLPFQSCSIDNQPRIHTIPSIPHTEGGKPGVWGGEEQTRLLFRAVATKKA